MLSKHVNKWISNKYKKILIMILGIILIFSFKYVVNASQLEATDHSVNIIDRQDEVNKDIVPQSNEDTQAVSVVEDTTVLELSQDSSAQQEDNLSTPQDSELAPTTTADNNSINIINAMIPAYSISKVTDNNVVIDYSNMPDDSAEELLRAFDDSSGECVEVIPNPNAEAGSQIYDSLTQALDEIDKSSNVTTDYTIVFLRNYDMTIIDTDATSLMQERDFNIIFEGKTIDTKVRFPVYIYLKNSSTTIQKMTIVDLEHVYAEGRAITIGNEAEDKRIIMENGTKPYIYGIGTENAKQTQINLIGGSYGDVIGGAEKSYKYTTEATLVNISNAVVSGNIYGGSHDAEVLGETIVNISNCTVAGFIIGGGYNSTATVQSTNITIMNSDIVGNVLAGGYYGNVTGETSLSLNGGSVGSWVLGGSYGDEEGKTTTYTGSTNLLIANTTVVKNIVGGGYYADVTGNTNMDISNTSIEGRVIGGCNTGRVTGITNIVMTGGNVQESVVGGGFTQTNKLKTVTGNTNIKLTDVDIIQSIYGGGYNAPVEGSTYVELSGGSVGQNIYGGGYNGSVNYSIEGTGNTNISVYNTIVGNESSSNTGNIYGGGSASQANVSGNVIINIKGGTRLNHILEDNTTGNIYGAGEVAETTLDGNVTITISGGDIGGSVYGAGDSGSMNGNPSITINGGTIAGNVYGGANKGKLTGSPAIVITGGSIDSVYGGSNKENLVGNPSLVINAGIINGNVFGGSLDGNITEGYTSSTINGGTIGGVIYGGSDKGSITNTDDIFSAVNLVITDCVFNGIDTVIYGGSNTGLINGNINLEIGNDLKQIQTLDTRGIVSGSNSATVNGNVNVIISNTVLGYIQNVNESNSIIKKNANIMIGNNVHLTRLENSIDGVGNKGKVSGESYLYLGSFDIPESQTAVDGSIVNVMNVSTYGNNMITGSLQNSNVIKTNGVLQVGGSIETFNQLFVGATENSTLVIGQNLDCKTDNDGDIIFSKNSTLILQNGTVHTVNNLVVTDSNNILRLTKRQDGQITTLKIKGAFKDSLEENSGIGPTAKNKLIINIQKEIEDISCDLVEGDNLLIFDNQANVIAANYINQIKGFSLHKGLDTANEANVLEAIELGKPKINLIKVEYLDLNGKITEFDTPSTPKNIRIKPDKRLTFDITDDESGAGFTEDIAAYIDIKDTPATDWVTNATAPIPADDSTIIKIIIEKGDIDTEGVQHWIGTASIQQCDSNILYYAHIKDNTIQTDNSANYSTVALDTNSPIKLSDSNLNRLDDKRIFKIKLEDKKLAALNYNASGIKYVGWSLDGNKRELLQSTEWDVGIENLYDIQKVSDIQANLEYEYSMAISDTITNKIIYIYIQDYLGNTSILSFNTSDTMMSATVNPNANIISLNNGEFGNVLSTDIHITNNSQKLLKADVIGITANNVLYSNQHTVVSQKTMYNPGELYLLLNYKNNTGQYVSEPLVNMSNLSINNVLSMGTIGSGYDLQNKTSFVINGSYQPTSTDMTANLDKFAIRYRFALINVATEQEPEPTVAETTSVQPTTVEVITESETIPSDTTEAVIQPPPTVDSTVAPTEVAPPTVAPTATPPIQAQTAVSSTIAPTVAPTTVPTVAPTVAPTTVAPSTQAQTVPPTTASTQASTEPQTQPPPPSTTAPSTEASTQASTESQTQPPPTEPNTTMPIIEIPPAESEIIITTQAVIH